MSKDYYAILGVNKDASQEDIKKAYKKLAKKYHPDMNKDDGAADKFKEISEAAAVLGDPQKRQQYDQFGTADSPFQGFDSSQFSGFDLNDIFEQIFGGGFGGFGGFQRQRGQPGRDLITQVTITLEDVADGVTLDLPIKRLVFCEECRGKGGENFDTCDQCHGQGAVRQAKRTPFGVFATTTTCRGCKGQGEVPDKICTECNGEGRHTSKEPIEVKIPAGIHDAMKVRVADAGEAGTQGQSPGDLYVVVNVKEDDRFKRHGNDLIIETPISFVTACLGGEIEVETLKGKKKMTVKAGTQDQSELPLSGEGLPDVRSKRKGDLIVKISIDVPKKLSKKQKELLEQFDKAEGKKILGLF